MGLFSSFLRNSNSSQALGVDIGTTSIKIVEARRGKKSPELTNYGILEYRGHLSQGSRVLQSSALKLFDSEAVDALRSLLAKMGRGTSAIVATIPIFSVFTTVVSLPDMSPQELENAMVFQAKQYVPIPLSEVALDWTKVGEYQDEKGLKHQNILLVSVPQETIKKYKAIFSSLGLDLKALEVESFSSVRSIIGSDPTATIIIDIGSRSTTIIFADKGRLTYHVQTDHASSSLTQAIASSLSINPLRAEDLKKERGVLTSGINFELSTIMMPFLDVIINEVKRVEYSYQSLLPKSARAERVVLSGGGANLLGIEAYFQGQLGVPVVRANALLRFSYPINIEPFARELGATLAVASGAVLREIA
jgi:type IV pilus assembly protein PilM